MMRKLAPIALFLILAPLCAGPLMAQAWKGRGRLQGQVVDPEGGPVRGAKVTLHQKDLADSGPPPMVTDKKGRWSYLGLKGGLWSIIIETENFMRSEGIVKVNEFGGPGKPIHVELKPPAMEPAQNLAAEAVDRGNELLQAGDATAARAEYEKALDDAGEASRPVLLRAIAQTWALDGAEDKAIELLEQSLTLAPEDSLTLKLLINVLLDAGRDEEAKPYIARLPAEEKLDEQARLNLGIDLYNRGEMEGALEQFRQAIADFPESADAYYYRGLVHMAREENDAARADLQRFVDLAPADSPRAGEARQFLEYLTSQ